MKNLILLLFISIFFSCNNGPASYSTCDCKDYVIKLFKSDDVFEFAEGSSIMRSLILKETATILGIPETKPEFKSKCHEVIYDAKSSDPCIVELLNEWEKR